MLSRKKEEKFSTVPKRRQRQNSVFERVWWRVPCGWHRAVISHCTCRLDEVLFYGSRKRLQEPKKNHWCTEITNTSRTLNSFVCALKSVAALIR